MRTRDHKIGISIPRVHVGSDDCGNYFQHSNRLVYPCWNVAGSISIQINWTDVGCSEILNFSTQNMHFISTYGMNRCGGTHLALDNTFMRSDFLFYQNCMHTKHSVSCSLTLIQFYVLVYNYIHISYIVTMNPCLIIYIHESMLIIICRTTNIQRSEGVD